MLKLDRLVKHTELGKSFAPKVSISPNGMISLSDAVTRKYDVGAYQYAVLYYDPQEQLVVIQLTNDKEEGTIKLRKRTTGAYIAGASFLGNFDIKLGATTIYDLQQDKESGFLFLDLKTGKQRKPAKPNGEEN